MKLLFRASLLPLLLSACATSADPPLTPPDPGEDTAPLDEYPMMPDAPDVADVTPPPQEVVPTDPGIEEIGPPVPDTTPIETGPGLGIDWEASPKGATARYEPESPDWTAMGWPNDRRRLPDGHLDLASFPSPGDTLLDGYLTYATEALEGFGLNGSIYFQLGGAPDLSSLPSAEQSRKPKALAFLVAVTTGSPHRGERRPLVFRWYGEGSDPFYLPGTLAMRPVFGHPLVEGERWCAVLTRGLKDADGHYLQPSPAFASELESGESLVELRTWLAENQYLRKDIAVASCFTTQDATGELRKVREFLETQAPPEVATISEPNAYNEFHGTYVAPNFQAGKKPYDQDGDLRFGPTGFPIVQAEETLRFMMLVPRGKTMPAAGWPVVVYAHGTGGDYESCRSVTDDLTELGHAVLCIDQPLHGSRGPDGKVLSDLELVSYSFNIINPRAGRMSFRQSAIDSMTLVRMIAAGRFSLPASKTRSGAALALDPDHITFMGHSHGGLSGALVLGVEPLVKAALISGSGGVIVDTILLRKDPFDIRAFVSSTLGIADGDFDTFHPVLSIIQMMIDATDPVNYAPYWLHPAPGGLAKHVLVTSGTADHATAPVEVLSMTASAGVPLISPIAKQSDAHDLAGLSPLKMPVSLNVETPDGPRTVGLKQWQDGTHWVAFDTAEGRALWRRFFDDLAKGLPPTIDSTTAGLPQAATTAAADACAGAAAIDAKALPATLTGNTLLALEDFAGCPGGSPARDVAYTFTPDAHGRYRFALRTPPHGKKEPPTGPDQVSVGVGCPQSACLGQDDKLDVELQAATNYGVVVDGSTRAHKGPYALDVSKLCTFEACGDRVCGLAGCTDCGTCPSGSVCTEVGQCTPKPPGDLCAAPLAVGALPYAALGDTHAFASDFGVSGCPGYGGAHGGAASDVVYHFKAPAAGTYDVVLGADFDAVVYALDTCGGACLGAARAYYGAGTLKLTLAAGQGVELVVDGAPNDWNAAGPYDLQVHACAKSCDGKACGDDGCGGSCGACGVERCVDEPVCEPIPYVCAPSAQCLAVATGDRCADPVLVGALPASIAGDSSVFYDDVSLPAPCAGGWGAGAADVVYRFTASATALYDVRVKADFDAALWVQQGACEAPTCLGVDRVEKAAGVERVLVPLEAGATVDIVVDGVNGAEGPYTLKVDTCTPKCEGKACGSDGCGGSCGGCTATEVCSGAQACVPRPGDTCADPIVVKKLPFDEDESTAGFASDLALACDGAPEGQGAASNDAVYVYTPGQDHELGMKLDAAFDATLTVATACDGECLAHLQPGVTATLSLKADVPVTFVIDGGAVAPAASAGAYSLHLWKPCTPSCDGKQCGGDGCGGGCGECAAPADACQDDAVCADPGAAEGNACTAPFVVDAAALPFVGQGDTSLAFPDYAFGDGQCGGWVAKGAASRDQVWSLVAPTAGTYTVTVATAAFDAVVYAVTSCADLGATCLAARDGAESDVMTLTLAAGQQVFVVVDGASNTKDQSGPYELRVDSLTIP